MAGFLFQGSVIVLIVTGGCALHYYDEDTGAEHVYGFGHMVMKVSAPKAGHQAVVTGTDLIGLGIGRNADGGYLSLGWDNRRRIEIIDQNTAVDLIWPDADFLNMRIGGHVPDGEDRRYSKEDENE